MITLKIRIFVENRRPGGVKAMSDAPFAPVLIAVSAAGNWAGGIKAHCFGLQHGDGFAGDEARFGPRKGAAA
ncbi:MAG: hypothetical protein Q7U63_00880 [Polaromonas sp.]|uniref:hypothetical protein n=1 Tax=Polaromonas sp. TaxID=1869339 RepID=UPI002721A91D|nr:hypothetical protein [Polaromonas sp.]MDO9112330.1 hypothetical protein [Polaromonas sp.]MDP1888141.1 hypothetical protein [Polaromonas sp.]